MNDPLTELATVPPVPIHPAVLAARASVSRVGASLRGVPDASLDDSWRWRTTDEKDVELRYGFYAIHERLESAIGAIEVGRAGTPAGVGPAVPALGALVAAGWDLHGVMDGISAETWDADPGAGEWTIRQTVGHIISGQLSYSWLNAWFLSHPVPVGTADYPPDGALPVEPTEEELATGTPAEVLTRFDGVVDASVVAVAALDRAALDVGARWTGLPVSMAFRLGRYGSHVREHTVQVDKTLASLGRDPTESERLARLILATYGRLEALVIGRPAADLERPFADGSSAVGIVAEALAEAEKTAASVRATATVG